MTASAIATVHVESGGRAYMGIGRGDSALAHLSRVPHSVAAFEDYLVRLQGYLRGEEAVLKVAQAYEQEIVWHTMRPPTVGHLGI